MNKRMYSNVELLKIASKVWATNKDIMALADCSTPKAMAIRVRIEEQIKAEGKLIPSSKTVPMKRVLKALDISLSDLERRALIEQKMSPVPASDSK